MKTESRSPNACDTLPERLSPALFRALGDETRCVLIARLACAGRPLTVTEAASCCGVHLSGVSRHLKILREAGVVAAVRRGREVAYELRRADVSRLFLGLAEALVHVCDEAACDPAAAARPGKARRARGSPCRDACSPVFQKGES